MSSAGAADGARVWRWPVLTLGILAVSSSSILVRLADAPPLVIGAWRLILATLIVTPLALPVARREWPRLSRRDWALLIGAGVTLALHFGTWITSLSYTSVASSVILVATNPLWVALASAWLLGERIGPGTRLGLLIAMLGTVVVSLGGLDLSRRAMLGNGLAILGAIFCSAYILMGRAVRRKLSTLAYVWPCYGIAGSVLALACLLGRGLFGPQPLWGYDVNTYLMLVALAIGPQLLGHSSFNWALAHMSPVFVTLAILGEPVGTVLLALVILGEVPSWLTLLGGALILGGILIASRDELPVTTKAPTASSRIA